MSVSVNRKERILVLNVSISKSIALYVYCLKTVICKGIFYQSMASNLESFTCLWLDRTVNSSEDNLETLRELRQIINDLRTFDNIDQCEKYIRQITEEKVVLIVSGAFGQQIVSRIHNLPQFSACYVFCQNKKVNEEWAKQYPKVKSFSRKIQQIFYSID